MNTRMRNRKQISKNLANKDYRDAFVSQHISTGIPFQIRAMRENRGWSQVQLAGFIATQQEGVSRLENPDYGRFSLATLKSLASAFDVALIVRFAPFSELVDHTTTLTARNLEVPSFLDDRGLTTSDTTTSTNVYDLMPELAKKFAKTPSIDQAWRQSTGKPVSVGY